MNIGITHGWWLMYLFIQHEYIHVCRINGLNISNLRQPWPLQFTNVKSIRESVLSAIRKWMFFFVFLVGFLLFFILVCGFIFSVLVLRMRSKKNTSHLPQLFSSEPSAQSFSPLQKSPRSIQLPSPQAKKPSWHNGSSVYNSGFTLRSLFLSLQFFTASFQSQVCFSMSKKRPAGHRIAWRPFYWWITHTNCGGKQKIHHKN